MALKTDNFKKKNNKRNLGALIGSIIILVIVVISFVVSPAIGQIGTTDMADIELGSYGDEKITFSFINETPFRTELAALSNNSTDSMDPRIAQVAYKRAVTKAAAIEEFNKNGYEISKEQLDDAVLKSGYYNVNGVFNTKVFKNTTEAKKLEIRKNIERDLKIDTWMNIILLEQKRSNKYLEFISSMSDNKRNFEYVTMNYSEYPDELVMDYAKNNSKKFTELSLSRITVEKMSTAETIISSLENSESTFEDLAKKYSTDNFKDNGGAMSSSIFEYELESVFGINDSSEILNLKVGGTPAIVEDNNQVILLTVNKEIVEPDFSDLSVIRNYMLSYERGTIEDYFYAKIENIEDNNLNSIGLEVKETGLFSINYGGEQLLSTSIDRVSQDSIFSRALDNENFFTILFKLEENKVSDPIVLGDSISVFKLKDEVSEETNTMEYVLDSLDRAMLNYKSQVTEDLIVKSDKYKDNFFPGYLKILSINNGY